MVRIFKNAEFPDRHVSASVSSGKPQIVEGSTEFVPRSLFVDAIDVFLDNVHDVLVVDGISLLSLSLLLLLLFVVTVGWD